MGWHPQEPPGSSVGLSEAWRLVSHVVNPSASAACPPPALGSAPGPPAAPALPDAPLSKLTG